MIKVPTAEDARQIELQKQSFVANTRLQLTGQFLNTIIGRLDVDPTKVDDNVGMALAYANSMLMAMGIIVNLPVE